jgi:hypothetical protein
MNEALEVGKKLVNYCKKGENMQAVNELYSPSIVSIEPEGSKDTPARQEGIQAIRGKHDWWYNNHEIHSAQVMGPWANGDRFTVYFKYDVTGKSGPMANKRVTVEETGLYTVKNGKVVQEEFFYDMGK